MVAWYAVGVGVGPWDGGGACLDVKRGFPWVSSEAMVRVRVRVSSEAMVRVRVSVVAESARLLLVVVLRQGGVGGEGRHV